MNLCASGRFEPYHAATQESDLEAAVSCLQSKLSRGVHGLKEVRPPSSEPVSSELAAHDRHVQAKEAERCRSDSDQLVMSPSAAADAKSFTKPPSVIDSGQYLIGRDG
jgi:hypothetical protein